MDLRLALYELAARHQLDAAATRRLGQIAGLDRPPGTLVRWLPRGVAALAAVLLGSGLIFWVSANWDLLGRVGQFTLLQAAVLLALVATLWRGLHRLPAALLALLGIGGLFAYFGQTYQTGADAWQLFALWAALAMPLGLALRSDLLWSAWVLVAMTAISLWLQAHVSLGFETPPHELPIWLLGWSCAVLLTLLLLLPIGGRFGAGRFARRVVVACTSALLTGGALFGLFQNPMALQYPAGLLLLAAAAAWLYRARSFDIAHLGCVALALDVLLLAGLMRGLYEMKLQDPIALMLLATIASALLLSLTLKWVLQRARAVPQEPEQHHG